MGLFTSLFTRRKPVTPRLTRAPRRAGRPRLPLLEQCEERRMLASDVLLGSVYFEEATGDDSEADTIQVSFVGGAAGTTLDRLVISGDKQADGVSTGDVFFDIESTDPGAFDSVGLSLLSHDGFTVTSVSVSDGGTSVVFELEGFEAGEELVFSVDVDEYQFVSGDTVDTNALVEGGEFQRSTITGWFSAPDHVDVVLSGSYFDAFDDSFASAESAVGEELTQLPDDAYATGDDLTDRTAGAVVHKPQQELARLSGYVYHDENDDGLFDAGEDPIEGVQLELLDAAGQGTGRFTTTNGDGYYQFTGLDAGTWGVRETQPNGWFDGKDSIGSHGGDVSDDLLTSVTLGYGDRATDYNFGELLPGSIAGSVHASPDGNCYFGDPGTPIEGVVIELLDAEGKVIETAQTDSQGRYKFDGLRPGEYSVREVQPAAYFDGDERSGTAGGDVSDDLVSAIRLGSGVDAVDYDFCEHVGASLSGYVYHDRSNDGVKDAGEEPIEGVTLKLLREDGSDTGQRAVTNPSGFYRFTGLEAGKYRVMEVHPEGWLDGLDKQGSLGGVADNPGDMIREIMLDFGDDATDYNFGELLPGSIAGSVHASPDGNCEDHESAAPIEGVVVQLLNAEGEVIATTQTDGLGRYKFEGLPPAEYSVRELQPGAYFDGAEHVGSIGGDVDDDLLSGIQLGSDVDAVGYDFCEIPPAALAGFVFIDGAPILTSGPLPEDISTIRDGVRSSDDTPLAGVRLQLVNGKTGQPFYLLGPGENEDDVPEGYVGIEPLPGHYEDGVFEALTDSRGYYEFRGLPSGSYGVVEVSLGGHTLIDGVDTPGTKGGEAVNPGRPVSLPIVTFSGLYGNDVIFDIVLQPGDFAEENNFSEVQTAQVPLPPDPVQPPTTPVFTPPPAPPVSDPLYRLIPPIEEALPPISGSRFGGYTWHLSVINGGQPRHADPLGGPQMRFASRSVDASMWSGADRAGDEMNRARWMLLASEIEGADLSEFLFGHPEAKPVSGDWDGDGKTDIGVYLAGDWYLDLNGDGRWDRDDLWAKLGSRDDLPVTGDWDGDGKTDIGVFGPAWPRDPHAVKHEPGLPDVANWPGPIAGKMKNTPPTEEEATSGARLLKRPGEIVRRTDLIDHVFYYGTAGDAPVVGDWNGDGVRTIGVFRDGDWRLDTNGDGRLDSSDRAVSLGRAGDEPIVGDWDGDGVDDLGVFRAGEWLVDSNGDGVLEATDQAFAESAPEGKPIVGDWDGDGADEPGVYTEQAAPQEGEAEVRVSRRAG